MIRNIYNHTIGRWQIRKELIVNNKEVSISSLKPRHELLLIRAIFSLLVFRNRYGCSSIKIKTSLDYILLSHYIYGIQLYIILKRLYYRLIELTSYTAIIKDRTDYNSIIIPSIF
jgi:hypothetical protein